MGKSIRSKVKRKHRSEFRATIGTKAHEAVMTTVQSKLQEVIDPKFKNTLAKVSNQLGVSPTSQQQIDVDDDEMTTTSIGNLIGTSTEDSSTTVPIISTPTTTENTRGENKVIVSKRQGKKFSYKIRALERKSKSASNSADNNNSVSNTDGDGKKRYRFHCEF